MLIGPYMSLNNSRWKKLRESRLIDNVSSWRFGLRQYTLLTITVKASWTLSITSLLYSLQSALNLVMFIKNAVFVINLRKKDYNFTTHTC